MTASATDSAIGKEDREMLGPCNMQTTLFRGYVILVTVLVWPVYGVELYVGPAGEAGAAGTRQSPLDLAMALGPSGPAQPGDTILLLEGTYDGPMEGIKRLPFNLAVSGTKERPIKVMPAAGAHAHLNGAVELRSSWVHYRGLEIGDLQWDPELVTHQVPTALNALAGEGAKVINCNIFGGDMGTGCWSPARDLEIYGCLIHDFGYLEGAGRGHGHCFYAQNETGTKTFMHNIAYRGCGWNVHVYTQAGQIRGFDIIENICYVAGGYKPGQTMDNFLVAGHPSADRIRLLGNIGYQPVDVQRWRPNTRLSSYRPVLNGSAEVRDNCFIGAYFGVSLGNWRKLTMTGNTVWATGVHVEISSAATGSGLGKGPAKPDLKGYTVDRNNYVANGHARSFYYGDVEQGPEKDEGMLTFADWQKLRSGLRKAIHQKSTCPLPFSTARVQI